MARVNRETRLSAARQIIRQEPGLSKEVINTRLKESQGVGLRYSDILRERRAILKESPKLIPEGSRYTKTLFGSREAYERELRPVQPPPPEPHASREVRLARARDIIRQEPSLRKEEVRDRLVNIFGKGLRDEVILKEKRGILKTSPKLIPEKNMTTRYIKALFGSQDSQRFGKLIKNKVWTKEESLALSKLPLTRLEYFEDMQKAREGLITQMRMLKRENHWSAAEYKKQLAAAIEAEYKDRKWLSKDGKPEIFRQLDTFRLAAIDAGEYIPPVSKNPDGTIRKSHHTAAEARRYRRTHSTEINEQKANYRHLHPAKIRQQRRDYRDRVKSSGGRTVHGRTIYPG